MRRMNQLVLAALLLVAGDARAEDEMSRFKTNVELAGWALPTLTLHTALHEHSHALAAKLIGAEHVQIRWMPGKGALGVTGWKKRGRTDGDVVKVAAAPVLTNLVVLGVFGVLDQLGAPSNEHARAPLLAMAGWAWGDLASQLLPFAGNDVEKAYRFLHVASWQRFALRALHLGVVVAGYYVLRRGYDSIADEQPAEPSRKVVAPLTFRF